MHNAKIGIMLLDAFVDKKGIFQLENGARRLARHLAREFGRNNAKRFIKELTLDNMGNGMKSEFLALASLTASRINNRNASILWESERNIDFIHTFLKRRRDVEGDSDPVLIQWIDSFEKDKQNAGFEYWYEIHKGITESLREF
jgi:glyceraldehyde-3-phosphate dehydrogenase (ferredoxin)